MRASLKSIGTALLAFATVFSSHGDWQSELRSLSNRRGRGYSPMVTKDAKVALGVNLDKEQAFKVVDLYADRICKIARLDALTTAAVKTRIALYKKDVFVDVPKDVRKSLQDCGLCDATFRWAVFSLDGIGYNAEKDVVRIDGISLALAGDLDLEKFMSLIQEKFLEDAKKDSKKAVVLEDVSVKGERAWRLVAKDATLADVWNAVGFDLHVTSLDGQLILVSTSRDALEKQILLYRTGRGRGDALGGFSAKEGELLHLRVSGIREMVPQSLVPGDWLGFERFEFDLTMAPDGKVSETVRTHDGCIVALAPVGVAMGALFPAISSAMLNAKTSAMAANGRKLHMAITLANVNREQAGKGTTVWPRTESEGGRKSEGSSEQDIGDRVFSSATDYFNALFDMKHYGTPDWRPEVEDLDFGVLSGAGVPGMTGRRLESQNVAWIVAANITDETPDFIPVLITANFNPSLLLAKWDGMTDGEKILPLGRKSGAEEAPFGDKGIVIVRKSGAAEVIKARNLTYGALYNKQSFDLTNMKPPLTYLTPTGSAESRLAEKTKLAKPRPVIDMLPATSVVVRVNNEDITKRDFATLERVYVKVFAMVQGWGPNTENDETRKFKRNNRLRVLDDLVSLALVSQYARAEEVEADAAEIAAKERDFLKTVNESKAKFADVAASFGPEDGEMLNRVMVQGAALTMAALVRSTTNDLYHVTEQEYMNRLLYVEKVNRVADASNAVVRARAMQAKKEILAGALFADVAKKYADFAPEQGNEWDSFQLDEFDDDDPLRQWLARSDVGDISDPLILDDGISIVGIKAKTKSDRSESNNPPVYVYDIVRCAFYEYDKLDDFDGDRTSIVEDIIRQRRQAARQVLMAKLKEKAKLEFPNGTNLFYLPEKNKVKKAGAKKSVTETR